jgi:hypothetical protein
VSRYSFSAEVWVHQGGAWHFVALPELVSDDIEAQFGDSAAGFGSIKVEVTIGTSTWRTSVFPDSKRETYVLPLKAPVRKKEGLAEGSLADITLRVVV